MARQSAGASPRSDFAGNVEKGIVMEKKKRCCHCKKELPLSAFCRSRSRPDGLNKRCRSCCKEYKIACDEAAEAAECRQAAYAVGGLVATVLNHAKQGEPKYSLRVYGANPFYKVFENKKDFEQALREAIC